MISKTAIIHPGVELGERVTVEDYCVIGCPNAASKGKKTIIGNDSIIRSHTVIYAGNVIGDHFSTGNGVNIRENNQIGKNVSIGTHSIIEHHVTIEDGVRIHSQVFVPEYCQLKRGSWLGPNVVLTNAKYPKSPEAKATLAGVTVEEDAIIGANCTVLPGVTIGKKSLVGAGSVVTKDVQDHQVMAGSPATRINTIQNLPYRGEA